jgi:hypothetical protein
LRITVIPVYQAVGYYALSHRVERVTSGVVVVDIFLDSDPAVENVEAPDAPLHMRFGDWTRPPIDFRFDPRSGFLSRVNLTLQDDQPETNSTLLAPNPSTRCRLRCDPADWPDAVGRYYDQRVGFRSFENNDQYLVVIIGEPATLVATDIAFGFGPGCIALVSPSHELRGVFVRLTSAEWQITHS